MAMKDRALIATGAVGFALAAICCAAPFLAVVLGAFGLTAWFAKAAYAVIPALLVCLALVALFRAYRPITVKKALRKAEGVEKTEANYDKKEAVLAYDDAKTGVEALIKATDGAGYSSEAKNEP